MTYTPKKQEFWFFKGCENCGRWGLKWTRKKQKVYVKAINQIVTSKNEICGKCADVVKNAIKERNI